MTATQWTTEDRTMAPSAIELRVAADPRHLPIVRAVAANIAVRQDFDLDSVSDLKLAVDEACSMLIRSAAEGTTMVVRFYVRGDRIRLSATVLSDRLEVPASRSFGWHVLTTLADATATVEPGRAPSDGHRHRLLIELVTPREVAG
jgi:serine/threonine-protein kinase RsbW